MEKKLRRQLANDVMAKVKSNEGILSFIERRLEQITLDQLYVSKFPNNYKYISLFPDGKYYCDIEKEDAARKSKREAIMQIILSLHSGDDEEFAHEKMDIRAVSNSTSSVKLSDFQRHGILPHSTSSSKAVETCENKGGSLRDVADDFQIQREDVPVPNSISAQWKVAATDGSLVCSASSSDNSDTSSDDETSNNGASDPSSVKRGKVDVLQEPNATTNADESDDEFFKHVKGHDDVVTTFSHALQHRDGMASAQGDKSKGWASQKPRSRQYKQRKLSR